MAANDETVIDDVNVPNENIVIDDDDDDDDDEIVMIDTMKIEELKWELEKLKLKTTGNKKELRERLKAALRRFKSDVNNIDEEESSGDDNDDDNENNDDDNEDNNDEGNNDEDNDNVRDERRDVLKKITKMQALSLLNIEDFIRPFSGDGGQNVRHWLKEFDEISEIYKWTEPHKIIYAKKLLRGSAKIFVFYEKRLTTWAKLKKSLISEFGKPINSKKIHQELTRTKKQYNESYQEYVYRMLEIADNANIETEAKIQYIVDGIDDNVFNKTILYGATNIKELRKKLSQYEDMRMQY